MPFLGHLAELRHRLLVIAVTISIGSMLCYPFTGSILSWLFRPIAPYLPGQQIFVTGPFEAFLFRFKIAAYAAIVLTSPIWLYQLLAFFLPALKPSERKYFMPTFVAILLLFLAGNLFCHYVVLPPSFAWLMAQTKGGIDFASLWYAWFPQSFAVLHIAPPTAANTVTLSVLPVATSFLGGVMIMMLAFGFTFELPVLLFFLMGVGIVKYATLRKNWRWVYLGLITFASLATPDWSPITIGALFAAVVVLYESTMLVTKFAFANRIKQQALEVTEAA